MSVIITQSAPDTQTYINFRESCGWGDTDKALAKRAIDNSLLWVSASLEGETIGFVRLIGDSALNFYIQDLIVSHVHRGKGIGADLMEELFGCLKSVVPKGATIGLMAVAGKEKFYESYGFQTRPAGRFGAGMTLTYEGE